MNFRHDENTIDPRDKNLVSYNKKSKRFVVEASSLKGAGIEPSMHNYIIGGNKYIIYMWSEKYQLYICYRHSKTIKDADGDTIADIFVPYFGIISTLNETNAHTMSLGTELHILND